MRSRKFSCPWDQEYGEYLHKDWLVDGETKANNQHYMDVGKSIYLVAN